MGEHEHEDQLDGCALDFEEAAIGDDEVEALLVPEGEEEDETDEEDAPLSPGSPDKGLATRLRRGSIILGGGRALFKVREVDGWKNRGRDLVSPPASPAFKGRGSVNHHTAGAGPSAGNAPSLGIVVNGRGQPNPLNGPLANVLQAYDNTAIVVAAGVANHAGSGSWRGLSGNSSVYGLEVEHPGTTKVTQKRVMAMASIHACFLWRPGGSDIDPRMTCQHREWSDVGKPDFATNFSTDAGADEFRKLVRQQLAKLNTVSRWAVSFLNSEGVRVEGDDRPITRDPDGWVIGHMPAMRRGRVVFDPKRG
jgi:hypothetical protein